MKHLNTKHTFVTTLLGSAAMHEDHQRS